MSDPDEGYKDYEIDCDETGELEEICDGTQSDNEESSDSADYE